MFKSSKIKLAQVIFETNFVYCFVGFSTFCFVLFIDNSTCCRLLMSMLLRNFRLDKFWQHQDILYDYKVQLTGVGNRSQINADETIVL